MNREKLTGRGFLLEPPPVPSAAATAFLSGLTLFRESSVSAPLALGQQVLPSGAPAIAGNLERGRVLYI